MTCLAIISVQDVAAFPPLNTQGGPITHSTTGSKSNPSVYLWFQNILAFGFISCHEPPSERWSIPDALNPFLTLCSGINRLSIRLKLLIVPSYFTLDVFLKFNSRDTSVTFPTFFFHQTINHIIKGQFTRSYSLLPHLNLGTRFLVVEEICNIPSITLQ